MAGSRTAEVEGEYGLSLKQYKTFSEFSKLCQKIGQKEGVVAIAWVLSNPAVYSTILGVRSVEQLDIVESAVSLTLEAGLLCELDALFSYAAGRPLGSGEAPEAFAW
jgi:aryl-alcohol dehydrogenase-like predicted oxidoreductase